MGRRNYKTLWLYVAKEFLLAFFIAFLFFFIIFFINQLLLMAEEILSQKAPVFDVVLLIIYATPMIVAMSFPFGSLVGALMAVGRLASDSELLVMRASGISRQTIMMPFVAIGMGLFIFSFVVNDYFLPLGIINYSKVYRKLITTAPALELKPHSVKRYQNTTIAMGEVREGEIDDVVIFDTTKDGKSRIITAQSAALLDKGEASGIISLLLSGVFIQETDPTKTFRFEYSQVVSMEYNILLSSFSNFSAITDARAMSSLDVARDIRVMEGELDVRKMEQLKKLYDQRMNIERMYFADQTEMLNDRVSELAMLRQNYDALSAAPIRNRTLDIYKLEYYKKFSIPAGALCFVFLAFPLGARAKKNGRAVGFGIGLLVAVLYWALLIGGQNIGLRIEFSPFWAMWLPNVFVLAAALPFFIWRKN